MKKTKQILIVTLSALALMSTSLRASSHMDAPLITLDPAANTTDVYAFVSQINGVKYLTTALAVYPFEEPGIGPNKYNFDDRVTYAINLATGNDVKTGNTTVSYSFTFKTSYKNTNTIAQSYLGPINNVDDANQNLTQRYTVQKSVKGRPTTILQDALVPPNNQGLVTRFYNQGDNGENPAKEGVAAANLLDKYTAQTVYSTPHGYYVFAGQRDDGFYADIQSIFDLDFTFSGPNKPFDSQGGFNVHTIVLSIPLAEIPGGGNQVVGVWASTSRQKVTVLRDPKQGPNESGQFVQVGRQGNPLFCEALVAIVDKDLYNRTDPTTDDATFKKYALNPELATILGLPQNLRSNRTDLAGIFIPDLIKVDLSTAPARLAGGTNPGAAPDDAGFHRLSIFGGDVLTSSIQAGFGNGTIPGGWPNGRRFGDDVLDIAVLALESDLRTSPPMIVAGASTADVDRVNHNDIGYNKVFPYSATPLNGRNHDHH